MILESYMATGNRAGVASYLRANGIVKLVVARRVGERNFALWEQKANGNGWPETFTRKRDAIALGKKLSEFTGLPLEIE
jgi:hypothetical protein